MSPGFQISLAVAPSPQAHYRIRALFGERHDDAVGIFRHLRASVVERGEDLDGETGVDPDFPRDVHGLRLDDEVHPRPVGADLVEVVVDVGVEIGGEQLNDVGVAAAQIGRASCRERVLFLV